MAEVLVTSFGKLTDGRETNLFTLQGEHGLTVSITNYGAAIVSVRCPDREGKIADVVVGFDDAVGYEMQGAYIGAVCGRVAGRIGDSRFTLDGKDYLLPCNDGRNHLHGGNVGFNRKIWGWRVLEGELPGVEFSCVSEAGEEGYPGNLRTTVVYTLQGDTLAMEITAATDAPTLANLTNHAYFNLSGDLAGSPLEQLLTLNAYCYLEIDETSIPTGTISPVQGTPFDFTSPHTIGSRIAEPNRQLELARGYDHPFCLNASEEELNLAAIVQDPSSGRRMEIRTNQPAVVFYSANYLVGQFTGRGGRPLTHRCSFCLETQVHPDAINHPAFPSIVLRPGECYRNKTEYTFTVEK